MEKCSATRSHQRQPEVSFIFSLFKMPSKALHRSKRVLYPAQAMRMAYDSVQSGQYSGRQAAAMFKVPYGTLNKKLSGRVPIDGQGAGRPLEIGSEKEQKLADYLFVFASCGYGLSRREILQVTGEFVREENIKTRWINGIPGFDWVRSFLKRHPRLKDRKDDVWSTNSVEPFDVIGFYQDLEHLYTEEKVIWNKAHRVYNLLEISLPREKQSNHPEIQQPNDHLTACVLTCICADGEKLPPLVVFQGKCVTCDKIRENKSSGDDKTLFCYWFENIFIPLLPRDEMQLGKSTILFFEGESLQINLRILKLARRNCVFFVKIPPKLSNHFQPLDLKCSSAINLAYNKQLQIWNKKNFQNIEDTQRDKFGNIVGMVWKKSANRSIIVKGFERTGLFPLDKSKFDEDVFSELSLKKFKEKKEYEISKNINDTIGGRESMNNELPTSADEFHLQIPKITHVTSVLSEDVTSIQHITESISTSSKNSSRNSFPCFEPKESSKSNFNSRFDMEEVISKEDRIPLTEEFRLNRNALAIEKTIQDGVEDLIAKTVEVTNDTRRSERIFKRDSSGVAKTSSVRQII